MQTDPLTARVDHLEPAAAARVLMTVSCRDADGLPKVPDAGSVTEVDGVRVQVMHNGVVVEEGCYYGPWMDEIIRVLRGHHEPQEELVFDAVLARLRETEPDAAMVELGSFWAYYSLWFLDRLPHARVVAMEPDPTYLATGQRNFALNRRQAQFVHGAVGAEPGATTTFVTESTGEPVEVVQHDLASLMQATDLDRVGILMVDIQGFETVLLEGARDLLASGAVRFLVVSTHHHLISGDALTHQRALALLTGLGAHVIAEHSVSESFSGDGLIAVSFDPRDRDLTVPVSHARARDSLFGELEPALDGAWAEAAAQRAAGADAGARAATSEAEVLRLRAELEAVNATKVMRWSRAPRTVYRGVRRAVGR